MTKEFTLDQFGWDRCTIHLYKRGRCTGTFGMKPTSNKFLSRTILARNQHPSLGGGHLLDQMLHPFDLRRSADDGIYPSNLGTTRTTQWWD